MATTFGVDLLFKANTSALSKVSNQLQGVDRTADKLKGRNPFDGIERGAKGASRGFDDVNRSARNAASGVEKVTQAGKGVNGLIGAVGRLAAAYGSLRIAQDVIGTGVQRVESTRRITALAGAFDEVAQAQEAASRAATKFGISQTEANQQFAQLYARLRPIGVSIEQIETAFNGFNTAAKLSGASATEASSAWLQLSQALGSGVLRGEELNSIFEQTPAIVQAIAKEMGVPIGQIRDLAQEGKITSDIVLRALKRIETEGADKLAEALKGPAQQFKNLQNASESLKVAAADKALPAVITGVKLLNLAVIGLNGGLKIVDGWLQRIANVDFLSLIHI